MPPESFHDSHEFLVSHSAMLRFFRKKGLAVSTCPSRILVIGQRSNVVSGLQIWSLRSGRSEELRLRDELTIGGECKYVILVDNHYED
jgi:hypothetical protein